MVMVAANDAAYKSLWQRNRFNYAIGATALTLMILLAISVSLRRQRRHEAEIGLLARTDALTQAGNRLGFREALARVCVDRSAGSQFALHLVDLDGFKAINDAHGHPMGDRLLQSVTDRIRSVVGPEDFLARLGGDEFAIIQSGCEGADGAEALAQRLLDAIGSTYVIDGVTLEVGASIGVACRNADLQRADNIVHAADVALYVAKSAGRHCVRVYTAALGGAAKVDEAMEADLRRAVAAEELRVHYQAVVQLASGAAKGYEALVRWQHPERGLVSPGEFIPLAEKSGLIVELGAWVLRRACRDMAAMPGQSRISVNVSPVQFRKGDFVAVVKEQLAATGLDPRRLTLEITESTIIDGVASLAEQLRELRALGVRIAIDDFGAGYSSLGYLRVLPVDCIKIDRGFVTDVDRDPSAQAYVRAINQLAGDLGLETIVEGVETSQQRDALMSLGSNEAQGFFFQRPMPELPTTLDRCADALAA